MRHLAFCVESVEQTVKELAEVGIKCEPIRVDDYTGKKMTFFHDRMDCRWSCMSKEVDKMIFRKAEKKFSMSWCCELWERKEHITPESLAAVERS